MCFDAVRDAVSFLIFERLEADRQIRQHSVADEFEGFVSGFGLGDAELSIEAAVSFFEHGGASDRTVALVLE